MPLNDIEIDSPQNNVFLTNVINNNNNNSNDDNNNSNTDSNKFICNNKI